MASYSTVLICPAAFSISVIWSYRSCSAAAFSARTLRVTRCASAWDCRPPPTSSDRKSYGEGKRVSVRIELDGGHIIKKKRSPRPTRAPQLQHLLTPIYTHHV